MLQWYIAGPIIGVVFFGLLVLGKSFGISSSLQTTCAWLPGSKKWDYFKIDQRKSMWRYLFILGLVMAGALTPFLLPEMKLSTIPIPTLFQQSEWLGWSVLAAGGFLVGFGARYAGGCTSGHAITGLSFFQWRSLLAVVGFFIGGLIATHFIL